MNTPALDERNGPLGSLRPQQAGPRAQALRQPAPPTPPRPAHGARRHTRRQEGVSIWVVPSGPDHRQQPGRQGRAVRPGGRQDLPPPDLLRDPRKKWGTCNEHAHRLPAAPGRQRRGAGPAQRRMVRPRPHPRRRPGAGQRQPRPHRPGRLLYQRAAELQGGDATEDKLAYFRDAHEFRNYTLLELPHHGPLVGYAAPTGLRHHHRAQLPVLRADGAGVGRPAEVRRRRPGRHRRQVAEGGQLPPAPRPRLAGAAGRRHRGIPCPRRRRRSIT